MKQFALWQAPFYSFWSKSFYVDVAKNWRGVAYSYLFLLICFTWVFMAIKKQMDLSYYVEHSINPIVQQMPVVTIDKGILSIDCPSPCTLKDSLGLPAVTFDTREKPMGIDEMPGNFLITKDSVYAKGQPSDQKIDLSTMKDHTVIDKKVAKQFLADFCKSVGLIVFMIAVPLCFIFCILQSLLYALMGILITRLNKVELSYPALIRLSVMAMTPVLFIDSIIKVRGLDYAIWLVWPLVAFLITCGYLIFGISVQIVSENNKPESV